MWIGSRGCCTGFGSKPIGAKSKNSPWNSGCSSAKSTRSAWMVSFMRRPRVFHSLSVKRYSSSFQPRPIAMSSRPLESTSSEAIMRPTRTGSRSASM